MRPLLPSLLFVVALATSACEDVPCLPTGEVTVRAMGTMSSPNGDATACFGSGELTSIGASRTAWISEDGSFSFADADLSASADLDACSFTLVQDVSNEDQTGEIRWYGEDKRSRQRWEGFGAVAITRSDGDCENTIIGVTIDLMVVQ